MNEDTFSLESEDFSDKAAARNETLFTVANGFLGLRGDYEEQKAAFHEGTYINGFYDKEPIVYGESAFGYAKNHQTILNLPNPKCIKISVNNHLFSFLENGITKAVRKLDFKTGIMSRKFIWTANDGTQIEVLSSRIACFKRSSVAAISYSIHVLNGTAILKMQSSIDTTSKNLASKEDPRVGSKFSSTPLLIDKAISNTENNSLGFSAHTRNSNLLLSGTVFHRIGISSSCSSHDEQRLSVKKNDDVFDGSEKDCALVFNCILQKGESITLEKYISYETSDVSSIPHSQIQKEAESLVKKSEANAKKAFSDGFEVLCGEQKCYLKDFWDTASVSIKDDKESERAIHFNLFQLLQSAGRNGQSSIAAKGLTAEGYEGHYFWDTESYICPVFTYLKPEIAAGLLKFRLNKLPFAKKRAEEMNLAGALFPWRTINGEETSAYFPAGTAQYHINGDIMFALNKLLLNYGGGILPNALPEEFNTQQIVDMAIQTARMWMSLGSYIPQKEGKFCINEVTGPDEYTACVNNNSYTNLIASENLKISARIVKKYGENKQDDISDDEVSSWIKAADEMYIPYDNETGIYPQDDSFMSKADWPFETTPAGNYPLLLHYHPLVIYRYRVLKQPDLVLAQFLFSGRFSLSEKIRNFRFYEKYTTGDSSLSHCVQSIMACETGELSKAWDYFNRTARMDIEDVHENTKDGIHTACMAGSWMSLVYGFAGFRDYCGDYYFAPRLPKKWQELSFKLVLNNTILKVDISHHKVIYSMQNCKAGDRIHFTHRNVEVTLVAGGCESIEFSLEPKFKAALFDLDGVITDTAEFHYQAWKTVCNRYHLDFDRNVNESLRGISRKESFEKILEYNKKTESSNFDIRTWSENRKQQTISEKNDIYLSLLDKLTENELLPGILPLLKELKSHGIRIILASASKNAMFVCKKLGIKELFDGIVPPESVKKMKPEPDIFLSAAQMADVWYTDCIGIEDAQAGIDAINTSGMCSCGIGTKLKNAIELFPDTKNLSYEALSKSFQKYCRQQ